ncbi:lipopolysaccharide assembly protein LapB [Pedobacter sp. SYSU D00535]|uniref:tetratricopeptide repeat protein n=1 Tax=Pedobacter sp. SYSU D00535 TaxID=2810308 RepID=UPI001A95BF7E|nr:hypothetical protein [Pedobacter sp. SYSU D00535]
MKAFIYLTVFLFFHKQGIASVKDSITVSKTQPDSITHKVDSFMLQASLLSPKKPTEAVKNYRKALVTNTIKDDLWEANVRMAMGKLLTRIKSKEAFAQLSTADALYKKQGDLYGRAEVTQTLAAYYEKTGVFTEAKKRYDELIKIWNTAGEFVSAGNTAFHLTNYYFKRRNYQEAFKYADIAKNAYDKVCKRDSLGSVYLRIAEIKRNENKPKLAEFYATSKALGFFSSADNLNGRLRTFDFLGGLHLQQKRLSQAKWFYIQANTQARTLADTAATISSLLNLSVVKILKGDFELARQDLQEASDLSKAGNFAQLLKAHKAKYPSVYKKINTPAASTATTAAKLPEAERPKTAVLAETRLHR